MGKDEFVCIELSVQINMLVATYCCVEEGGYAGAGRRNSTLDGSE